MHDMIPLRQIPAHFPSTKLKVTTLRAQRDRGNLRTYMVGNTEYTTLADVKEMFERCAVTPKGRASGSDPNDGTPGDGSHTARSGSSATAHARSAQAAAQTLVKALKGGSQTTSRPSSARRGEAL